MKSVFNPADVASLIERIEKLHPHSQPRWGRMNAAQMLAHCNVTYEMVYDDKHTQPNIFLRIFLRMFVKNTVVSEAPYQKNLQTAPAFIVQDDKNFVFERKRLIAYIQKTLKLGGSHFEGKKSLSFGVLTEVQWNNMLYKHLDHHLSQFGA